MRNPTVSATDLVKKFTRACPSKTPDAIAWGVLDKMVDGLTETKLPIASFRVAIAKRDVGALFQIADSLSPQMYDSPSMLLRDRLAAETFKKFSFSTSPFNKREKAKLRFFEAEHLCREANLRIRFYNAPAHVNEVIHLATREIANVLGRFNVDEILDGARFGPGATLCVTGSKTTEYFKYAERQPTVSSGAFPYAEALLNYDQKWLAHLCHIHPMDVVGRFNLLGDGPELRMTDYNKVTFVPKNAKTERSIAIEPYFNLYFQLGVGAMLRRRLLKNFNIDLTSQKQNQNLARQASIENDIATVDHSMASDTLAIECVRALLPPTWFDHLDRLRSRDYLLDGVKSPYHKFSSMGNGFTFELETLIFASLARGAHVSLGLDPNRVSVYGDDVILSSSAYNLYKQVTEYLGFRINDEKSFVSGPFRESCGEDFLRGFRVRPVFCEELGSVRDIVSLSNRLSALNRAVDFDDWDHGFLARVLRYLRKLLPKDIRKHLVGPSCDEFDTHIHDDNWQTAGSTFVTWDEDIQTWRYPVIRFRPRKFKRCNSAFYMTLYTSLGRGSVTGLMRNHTPFSASPRSAGRMTRSGLYRRIMEVHARNPVEVTGRKIGDFHLSTASVL